MKGRGDKYRHKDKRNPVTMSQIKSMERQKKETGREDSGGRKCINK